jgi:hypothetical protein
MDKVTDSLDWKKDELVLDQYTGPVQEPLTQPDLVSKSQVDQYKNQKQAQINATLYSQATPVTPFSPSYKSQPVHRYTPSTSSPHPSGFPSPSILPLMGLLLGFLIVGVMGVFVGSSIVTAVPTATGTLAASQQSIIDTISMGVSLCKIMIVVTVGLMIFLLMRITI